MRIHSYLFAFICFFPFKAVHAAEQCDWNTWPQLAEKVVETSPEISVLKSQQQHRSALVESASIKPPSTLSGQYTSGNLPWRSGGLEASYLWTIESSEKRESRINAAKADTTAVAAEIDERKSLLLLNLALIQQELKRIAAKREVLIETQATYAGIIRQYANRLSLGPEQTASLTVFKIAKNENDLRIEALEVERSQLIKRIGTITGCVDPKIPKVDTKSVKWPSIVAENIAPGSPSVRKLEAQAESLQKSLQADLKNMKPDLSIGPMVTMEHGDEKTRFEAGIAASMPVGASRITALSASRSAEYSARQSENRLSLSRIEMERSAWVDQYKKSLNALKSGLSKAELSKSHKSLETLFRGERVSASLVIESHRQLLEHTATQAELEAKASEALWNLKFLDGSISWRDL
jgi:hypothetical protein